MAKPLAVAVSLDVEEEGLFRGMYQTRHAPVTNLAHLYRLDPLLALGIRPTFFCAWPVFTSGWEALGDFTEVAEIGAHLHWWNTPPLAPCCPDHYDKVPARQLALEEFRAKMANLLAAGTTCAGKPIVSFRMGRWDLHRQMLPTLIEMGLRCDASVRPLHWRLDGGNGPDHFAAPADPYYVETRQGKILEVPLTVIPLLPFLRSAPPRVLPRLTQWGALALLSVYHPLWLLKVTTALHVARGGHALSLTWHSSEMLPGGTPHLPDEASVTRFLTKMLAYFRWLLSKYDVEWVHMRELWGRPFPACAGAGDWSA